MLNEITNGDALSVLKALEDNSIDLVCTDPPYGYAFMNKAWDKLVGVDVWAECLRVLKPGAFAFIMSSPRQDVLSRMIVNIEAAGFRTDFTSIYWTYATGFPKGGNISKLIDKRQGAERAKIQSTGNMHECNTHNWSTMSKKEEYLMDDNIAITESAKKMYGCYGGFQPKPAVEIILVCMKPLCKDSYIDQALANGKGVTWLDDCRIPYTDDSEHYSKKGVFGFRNYSSRHRYDRIVNGEMDRTVSTNIKGRFPTNLLVCDDMLNDSYSRYFDLGKWFETTFPFCIVSKASPTEREKGLDSYEPAKVNDGRQAPHDTPHLRAEKIRHNTHPTIKPIKLMAWLITLGSRPGDIILDPFAGSGTTCIAAQMLKRNFIGIEIDKDFAEIARARLKAWNTEKIL